MFQRRLKIVLVMLLVFSGLLLLRALQLQVIGGTDWAQAAAKTNQRPTLLETTRGRILDYKGREVAIDVPCIDLCVDYRAIVPQAEKNWLQLLAAKRLQARMGETYPRARAARLELIEKEL